MALQGRILHGEELGALAERREGGGVGAGQPGLGAKAAQRLEQRRPGAPHRDGPRPRRGAGSAAARPRRRAAAPRPGSGSTRSAFCWPVEQSLAGRPEARSWTTRSLRCGPTAVVPVSASWRRAAARAVGEALLDVERRHASASQASTCPSSASSGWGKPAGGSIRAAARPRTVSRRAAATATPAAAIWRSSAREPGRVDPAGAQQLGPLAQGMGIARELRRMRRIAAHHQPIEEAPPLAGAVQEQPVHRRGQPDHGHDFGQRRLAQRRRCRRSARSGARARRRWARPVRISTAPPGASRRAMTDQGPAPPLRSISPRRARRRPRPGARNEIASSRLVLPAPFGPVSTTGRGSVSSRSWA